MPPVWLWQLEVPFSFLAKGPSMRQPHAADGRSLARTARFSLSSPGTGLLHWLSRSGTTHPGASLALSRRRCCLLGETRTKILYLYIYIYIHISMYIYNRSSKAIELRKCVSPMGEHLSKDVFLIIYFYLIQLGSQ